MNEIKKSRKTRRTEAEREEWAAKWRASGKTVPVFAAEQGLASSSLYQWVRPAKAGSGKSKRGGRRKPAAKAAFHEVSVVGERVADSPSMTVALAGGRSVSFEGGPVDPRWLASVLKVVSAC